MPRMRTKLSCITTSVPSGLNCAAGDASASAGIWASPRSAEPRPWPFKRKTQPGRLACICQDLAPKKKQLKLMPSTKTAPGVRVEGAGLGACQGMFGVVS